MTWSLPIGDGTVLLHEDGFPVQFRHPGNPDQLYLLDEDDDRWHSPEHRWGTGFVITNRGSGRWRHPQTVDRLTTRFAPLDGLRLTVDREGGDRYRETYTWMNEADAPLTISSLGMSLPVRDVYTSSADALHQACHAHV